MIKPSITRWLIGLCLCAAMCSAQTVQPIRQPHETFLDNSGNPCAGCSLFSYQAGTTTPQPTYTDSSGSVQNTNPIVLDASGGANVWVGSTAYKFSLVDTYGTVLWTVDNVPAATFGTLTSVGLTLPSSVFSVSGSPLTGAGGTLAGSFVNQAPNTLFANCTGSSSVPTFCQLTAAMIAPAGTLSNSTTGNAATATAATTASSALTAGSATTAGALAVTPSQCGAPGEMTGIQANGNANCAAPPTQKIQTLIITSGICTTPGASPSWGACTFAATWAAAFVDTGYAVTCTVGNPGSFSTPSAEPVAILYVTAKTTSNITIALQSGDTSGAVPTTPAEIDCIGIHP